MFTNLIGFIKPLLKKNTTETKTVARTRPIGEDEPRTFKDYEDGFEGVESRDQKNHPHPSDMPVDDKLELSTSALRHLVEQADAEAHEKQSALQHIINMEQRGITSLSIPVGTSIVSFLNTLD